MSSRRLLSTLLRSSIHQSPARSSLAHSGTGYFLNRAVNYATSAGAAPSQPPVAVSYNGKITGAGAIGQVTEQQIPVTGIKVLAPYQRGGTIGLFAKAHGISENYQGLTCVLNNAMPRILGNLGKKLGFAQVNPLPASLKYTNSIHSGGPKEFERGLDNWPVNEEKNSEFFDLSNQRLDYSNRGQPPVELGRYESLTKRFADMDATRGPVEPGRNIGLDVLTRRFADMDRNRAPTEMGPDGRPFARGPGPFESGRNMNFVRGIMKHNENYRSGVEQNAHIVHIKILRNNTFVTVTDSKGNKKMGASAGLLAEMKGGPKVSKYSAEATAEHVGRLAKSMGLKSVVIKVNGFTFFKKKKLAILSFRDGYTNSRSDRNPIVYLEDTTRKAHNGCRLKKQRRV